MNHRSLLILLALCLVLLASLSRLLPHPPNFTPLGAIALFAGVFLWQRWWLLVVPLAALYLSDVLMGYIWHDMMPFVYAAFALIVVLGLAIRHRPRPLPVFACALTGSIGFFVITNLGVWLRGTLYPMTWEGLMACYVAAIPFFRHQLAGDLLYTALLFGVYWACCYAPWRRLKPATA